MVARLAVEMVVGVNSIHWLLWVTNVVSARNYLARRDVRKQKAVLGTDDNKHVYFKMRNSEICEMVCLHLRHHWQRALVNHDQLFRLFVYYDACHATLP